MPGDARIMAEIEELKKKLLLNPESLIFVPLADAYRKAGMHEEGIDTCKKGLEKHPTYTSARVVLGRIYNEKNKFDEAIEELKKVEMVDDDNLMVHSMLGNVYLKKKLYASAIEQFQKVLSLNPEDAETVEKLQEALSAKQEPGKAEAPKQAAPPVSAATTTPLAPAKPAAPEKPKVDVSKSLKAAELYTKKEEFDKAIEILKEVLDLDQENIIVQQRLREVYDFQDKKIRKANAKPAAAVQQERRVEADKITTEDILDVMKEAVEDDRVEEEERKAAEKKEVKPAANAPAVTHTAHAAPAAPVKTAAAVPASIDAGKGREIEKILKGLMDVEGVVGSFFLMRDGKIVASVLPSTINANDIGKHIATIVDRTEQSVKSMNQGKLNQVVISSEAGQLLFTEVGSGVLFMIGNEGINVGKMRLMLKDVIDHIKKVLM
jgi:predicted regulator of Ras-like GTPase activity (Roadblock/LC7/MglB family)/tetratricopeptide (TPR) repeat protein